METIAPFIGRYTSRLLHFPFFFQGFRPWWDVVIAFRNLISHVRLEFEKTGTLRNLPNCIRTVTSAKRYTARHPLDYRRGEWHKTSPFWLGRHMTVSVASSVPAPGKRGKGKGVFLLAPSYTRAAILYILLPSFLAFSSHRSTTYHHPRIPTTPASVHNHHHNHHHYYRALPPTHRYHHRPERAVVGSEKDDKGEERSWGRKGDGARRERLRGKKKKRGQRSQE